MFAKVATESVGSLTPAIDLDVTFHASSYWGYKDVRLSASLAFLKRLQFRHYQLDSQQGDAYESDRAVMCQRRANRKVMPLPRPDAHLYTTSGPGHCKKLCT